MKRRLARSSQQVALTIETPAAVVVGLDSMQGLQLARILAGHGVSVYGLVSNPRYHAAKTRVCREVIHVDTSSEALVDLLLDRATRFNDKPVLFPCQDENVLIVSRNRHLLEAHYRIVLPEESIVEMMADKSQFYAHARQHGYRVPDTFVLQSRQDAEHAARSITYPCLLKPPRGVPGWNRQTRDKALRAETPDELLALYDQCQDWTSPLLAQQWVEGTDGDLYSCNAYFGDDHRPLVTFVARKVRQWPPGTGKSSSGEEIRQDEVLATSIRIFSAARMRGLAYMEFKRDQRTGELFIIEPNIGRPTGRSAIAEAGGVELHYTMYCDAAGLPLPESRTQRYVGAKWINILRDLQSAAYYGRRGQLTFREWIRSVRGKRGYAIFSWRDPAPFAAALAAAVMPWRRHRIPHTTVGDPGGAV